MPKRKYIMAVLPDTAIVSMRDAAMSDDEKTDSSEEAIALRAAAVMRERIFLSRDAAMRDMISCPNRRWGFISESTNSGAPPSGTSDIWIVVVPTSTATPRRASGGSDSFFFDGRGAVSGM